MILTALNSDHPLELTYREHVCDCARGLSPEVVAFVDDLLFSQDDLHETKLLAMHSL